MHRDATADREVAPRAAPVNRALDHAPPVSSGTNFVEKKKRPLGHLQQHRVPGTIASAVGLEAIGDLDRLLPMTFDVSCEPYPDVGIALAGAAEPGRDQIPAAVSAIVDACDDRYGACSLINSDATTAVAPDVACA